MSLYYIIVLIESVEAKAHSSESPSQTTQLELILLYVQQLFESESLSFILQTSVAQPIEFSQQSTVNNSIPSTSYPTGTDSVEHCCAIWSGWPSSNTHGSRA